ncbi:MAG: glycosyltransferase [Blastomonas sp.]
MTPRPIGYYVHHHGAGHLARARVIRDATSFPVTLLGSRVGTEGFVLADDRLEDAFDGQDRSADRPEALHYAPLDHEGIRSRTARIAQWIEQERPALMIVDVSVEVAMLARLASVPVLYVRLSGRRDDPAHLEAFRGAQALIAPFARKLEHSATPEWVRAKTFYAPGLTDAMPAPSTAGGGVLVILGEGGTSLTAHAIAKAASACPQRQWRVIGNMSAPPACPANLVFAGWCKSVADEIANASVVVGAAGNGVVGLVMASDRPFVCIPEPRPFGEQVATAAGLERSGAAIVRQTWPDAQHWPAIIASALALDPAGRRALHDPHAARKLARWLEDQAAARMTRGLAA